jgi:3-hydroxyisobutyrate dehydrogenase
MKLVINHTLYLNQAAAIEGLVLGLKAGLDPNTLFDAITSGAASSDLLLARGKDMLAGNFGPKGPTRLAIKDLRLSLETGRQLGVMLPVGSLYLQFLLQAQYNGWEYDDATVVMRIYEQLAGIEKKGKK